MFISDVFCGVVEISDYSRAFSFFFLDFILKTDGRTQYIDMNMKMNISII